MREGLSGTLRMGAIPTALTATSLLTTPFCGRYPHVRVLLTSLSSREIARRLAEFEIDMAMTYLDDEEDLGEVRTSPLYEERYLLAGGVPVPVWHSPPRSPRSRSAPARGVIVQGHAVEVLNHCGVVLQDVIDGLPVVGEPWVREGFLSGQFASVVRFVGCDCRARHQGAGWRGRVFYRTDTASERDPVGAGTADRLVRHPGVIDDDVDPRFVDSVVVVAGRVVDRVSPVVVVDEACHAFEGGLAAIADASLNVSVRIDSESHARIMGRSGGVAHM
ncbi:LysR family transcriptional regulator substrate-binding protein [Nonomuraea sp. CA-141351]|uniref:LysR family transcriptional regulator substrate-binding protein n=1 Tax=Nonomuraea sp. CA-141351 TaxID=3239996 RepID=UPI003D928C2C